MFHLLSTDKEFADRHIGPRPEEQGEMLMHLECKSLDALSEQTVPENIRFNKKLDLPQPLSEFEALTEIKKILSQNQVFKNYIGQGYHGTITPPVILRNILENPGWYTQYTPYQSEISQGRLEALLNFQTLVSSLTGLPISNASLLDEATAAAEAMMMASHIKGSETKKKFFVSELCHPQTLEVLETRAEPLGIELVKGDHHKVPITEEFFGSLVQFPTTDGRLFDYSDFSNKVHSHDALSVIAADPMALVLMKSPKEMGADIAVGSTQRFGVPMGFGGPHAAYFATKEEFVRQTPGRIVGASIDNRGKTAFRLALQTREQHIRREKATSNICTAQVLLAIVASMYAVYHGPEGLKKIATRIHWMTKILAAGLKQLGFFSITDSFFDTVTLKAEASQIDEIFKHVESHKINFRRLNKDHFSLTLDETTTTQDLDLIFDILGKKMSSVEISKNVMPETSWFRTSEILTHEIFNKYRSETDMLRYINRLQSKDLSLTTSMIPLGSCTMKLNATAEMEPVTWTETGSMHPFAPSHQSEGYKKLFSNLESWLCEITGFSGFSLQPNAGSQGEYAGLLTIRKYHQARREHHRNVCLIPSSAHGTNPASAVMVGYKVVVVQCDTNGNVDLKDLADKATLHSKDLAALMVTYPSTHGVFESGIREICKIVHDHGGQVYMDGANMNAQIGLCRPGEFGPDVCHLNLHKTFCIPHGGGGPGMGPIGVAKHLVPHLPAHHSTAIGDSQSSGAVSATAWSSASILVIPWMYIRMMGAEGLKLATQVAILNANYIAKRLDPYFPVLYKGANGRVAHECIVDFRHLQAKTGITVEDVAKRLMDYNFHAPTVSFPVAGTMMIEPTESESKAELDRFCEALISIHAEIKEVLDGKADNKNNLLKNAPHTADQLMATEWSLPYSRERAAFPLPWVRQNKFWTSVGRINNPHGDRNLICSCPPLESYSP